jgi:hypothetical protein
MKDYLLDLVRNTHDLGCFEAIKVTGTAQETTVDAMAEDRSVILLARSHHPIPEFMGVFGMPNLDKLKILLNLAEYREGAAITVSTRQRSTDSPVEPVGLHFTNAAADFQNDYRFMTAEVVAERLKTARSKSRPRWHMEFEPTQASIQRLKMQAQAHSEERLFQMSTRGGDLALCFGDHSTHAGEFRFQTGTGNVLTRPWCYPVRQVISILDLAGDKTMRVSDEGMTEITVDSGLMSYQYTLLAQTK